MYKRQLRKDAISVCVAFVTACRIHFLGSKLQSCLQGRLRLANRRIIPAASFDDESLGLMMVAGETDWQQKISEMSESLSRNQAMTTKDNDGLIRAAKDITAGSVGGIAQVLTGQPFDIVKVYPSVPELTAGASANATVYRTTGIYRRHRLCQENHCE